MGHTETPSNERQTLRNCGKKNVPTELPHPKQGFHLTQKRNSVCVIPKKQSPIEIRQEPDPKRIFICIVCCLICFDMYRQFDPKSKIHSHSPPSLPPLLEKLLPAKIPVAPRLPKRRTGSSIDAKPKLTLLFPSQNNRHQQNYTTTWSFTKRNRIFVRRKIEIDSTSSLPKKHPPAKLHHNLISPKTEDRIFNWWKINITAN